jgi:hypothetical protein
MVSNQVFKYINNDLNLMENYQEKVSFNADFCLFLEFHLCETFANSDDEVIRYFWCDGIAMPILESQITKKSVNDTRKIISMAWLGKSGQIEYELIIHFGKYSLRRYAKGNSLIDCVPSADSMDWIQIDIENRKLEIFLN